jgi:hypothetical protein
MGSCRFYLAASFSPIGGGIDCRLEKTRPGTFGRARSRERSMEHFWLVYRDAPKICFPLWVGYSSPPRFPVQWHEGGGVSKVWSGRDRILRGSVTHLSRDSGIEFCVSWDRKSRIECGFSRLVSILRVAGLGSFAGGQFIVAFPGHLDISW